MITPGTSERGRRQRKRLWTALAAVLAVVIASGIVAVLRPGPPCPSCVTDGSQVLNPGNRAMRLAEDAIQKENSGVKSSGKPYVSIALLIPLTSGATSDAWASRMADQLRGAYLALHSMNAQHGLGVRLLLANEGTSAELAAGQAVGQLKTLEGAPDHLVAVVGMGLSNGKTMAAAKTLEADHMPMFGAVMSADELNGDHVHGLDQMVPDDFAQVTALAKARARVPALARALPGKLHGLLVYDQQPNDLYPGNLKTDFRHVFRASLAGEAEPFTPDPPYANVEFGKIASDVCYEDGPPPVVFFAGRANAMASFIQMLKGTWQCRDKKVTIVTGGDGDGLEPGATSLSPGSGQVSVIYPDVFDLSTVTVPFARSYRGQLASVDPRADGLGDTWTLGTYNAMQAAWTAIELGYRARKPTPPGKADVLEMSSQLNGESAPAGATGSFSILPDGKLLSPDVPIYEDTGGTRITVQG
jgi:hypothetical protein